MQLGSATITTDTLDREAQIHRLVMFHGPCGAGKTTLARRLWEELRGAGIASTLLPEEEIYELDALQPYSHVYERADPEDLRLLLESVRTDCDAWHASGSVWLTDTYPPAFRWLVCKYPPDRIRAYAEGLLPVLAPLNPIVVSLEADARAAWDRAVADRGQEWSDWMVEIFSKRNMPLNPRGPIHDLESLLQSFEWEQRQCRDLIARWPVQTLVIDTEHTSLDQALESLLRRVVSGRSVQPSGPLRGS
jgi:hypothetical protein